MLYKSVYKCMSYLVCVMCVCVGQYICDFMHMYMHIWYIWGVWCVRGYVCDCMCMHVHAWYMWGVWYVWCVCVIACACVVYVGCVICMGYVCMCNYMCMDVHEWCTYVCFPLGRRPIVFIIFSKRHMTTFKGLGITYLKKLNQKFHWTIGKQCY